MSAEINNDSIEQANFNLLKAMLDYFIKNNFNVCDNFLNELKNCTTNKELKKLFIKYNDEVYDYLGGEPDLQDEIDDLEDEVSDLKSEIYVLEHELNDYKSIFGDTLNDEYKRDIIIKYYDKYTPWELEELLIKGKELLTK